MKRQLPQAEALEDSAPGGHSSDSSGPHACKARVECPSIEGSPVTGATNKLIRLAAALDSCPEGSLPTALAEVRHALTELEELAGVDVADPSGSQSKSLSSTMCLLDDSEEGELGLETEVNIDQKELKGLIADYVIEHEPEAERIIEEFNTGGTKAFALTAFKHTSMKVSAVRLAIFTGKRFLYSSCADMNGSGQQGVVAPLRCDEAVHIPCACATELELFLNLVKGQPPEKVALKDAIALFRIIEYSVATPLSNIWIRCLVSVLKQLSEKQMATVVSSILGNSLCYSPAECSPLTFFLSTWKESVEEKVEDASRWAKIFPEVSIFASKILERAGSGDTAHVKALLQICNADCVPRWLKIGSIAATLCRVQQAHTDLTEECCSTLRDMLLNCCGGRDVACVLGDAYNGASHQARNHVAALTSAMVEHVTSESHKMYLWFTENTIVDSSLLLEPASEAADAPLLCLPLLQKDCFLFAARMRCDGQTRANRSWSLELEPCSDYGDTPSYVPHVGVFLRNLRDHARNARYALGMMPATNAEVVCHVLKSICKTFKYEGFEGLKAGIVNGIPVFAEVDENTFPPLEARGFPWLAGGKSVGKRWESLAGAGWNDWSQVGLREVVAFCVLEE